MTRRPILLAGPTASGKSAVALELARRLGGIVINADSMQVYRELPILTAQPSIAERSAVPHLLYGHVPACEAYSVGRWLGDLRAGLDAAAAAGQRAIIVGGTGLYLKALLEGLAAVPPIDERIRTRWRAVAAAQPAGDLHALLAARDPVTAARLATGDVQRVVRALEVHEATGRPLSEWHQEASVPVIAPDAAHRFRLEPPRIWLRERCARRFGSMIETGAVAEVRELMRQGLPGELPAMRALGVAPLIAHLNGEHDLATAAALATADTGRYVKRQQTWSRKFMADWQVFDPSATATEVIVDAIVGCVAAT